jgi:hypothetical protein
VTIEPRFTPSTASEKVSFSQRLDRERDALALDIDLGDHGLDHVALAVVLDRLLAALVPAQVGQVHHAVDVALEPDEQAELGDVLDLALDLGARRVGSAKTPTGCAWSASGRG